MQTYPLIHENPAWKEAGFSLFASGDRILQGRVPSALRLTMAAVIRSLPRIDIPLMERMLCDTMQAESCVEVFA